MFFYININTLFGLFVTFQKGEHKVALLHKAILEGFFSNISSRSRSLSLKSTVQLIGPRITQL